MCLKCGKLIECDFNKEVIMTWYEIGETDSDGGTSTVFSANTLLECLEEWNREGYNESEYFIDIWTTLNKGTPYPIANIKDLEYWLKKEKAIRHENFYGRDTNFNTRDVSSI